MRRATAAGWAVALAAALGMAPAPAAARPVVGVEGGYAVPYGDATEPLGDLDPALDAYVDSQVPVSLDVGWRFGRHLVVGAYGSYGLGAVVDDRLQAACDTLGHTCSVRTVRAGLQAVWRFAPRPWLAPWAGIGTGWEWFQYAQEGGGGKATTSGDGWEIASVRLGLDLVPGAGLAAGPFLSATYARYREFTLELPDRTRAYSTSGAYHGWLQAGLRVSLAF